MSKRNQSLFDAPTTGGAKLALTIVAGKRHGERTQIVFGYMTCDIAPQQHAIATLEADQCHDARGTVEGEAAANSEGSDSFS